jgi:predicted signal transduction protein with EAL and GGDEF domain
MIKVPAACSGCRDGATFSADLAMAFQPIVDLEASRVFAYEALVRGPAGEAANSVLDKVSEETATVSTRNAASQRSKAPLRPAF